MQLHNKYQNDGLTVITLNMDGEEKEAEVDELLRTQNINLTNLVLREAMAQPALEAVDSAGVLPAVNLYDRQGQLRHQLSGVIDRAELDGLVQALLEER